MLSKEFFASPVEEVEPADSSIDCKEVEEVLIIFTLSLAQAEKGKTLLEYLHEGITVEVLVELKMIGAVAVMNFLLNNPQDYIFSLYRT